MLVQIFWGVKLIVISNVDLTNLVRTNIFKRNVVRTNIIMTKVVQNKGCLEQKLFRTKVV